ncbi:MAG TPA: adenylate/guanylate cyclase domain-containing protein, partial [Chloroflexota bacterium]|nr:adenylate/guanylate cyclase domain-containing protein [Chloroflexota bacterium]
AALSAGADEYLAKPVDQGALVARVKSMLRIKALHDTVQRQTDQLAEWNRTLEDRVTRQVHELDRLGRLRRFLAPQLAEVILSSGDDSFLQGHRAEVAVVMCDFRGWTAFTQSTEPEEIMSVLRQYHEAMGALVHAYQGTLERFTGDGFMVFFNDPLPQPDAPERSVTMAVAMRDRMAGLLDGWRRRGHQLGHGIGIALGYATAGRIGFEGRYDYAAIGPVTNLAGRLSSAASDGQILVSERIRAEVDHLVKAARVELPTLKGLTGPTTAYEILRLTTAEPPTTARQATTPQGATVP